MVAVISLPPSDNAAHKSVRLATTSWVLVAVFYFYQYVLRSAPSVMMPQLTDAFGLSSLGVASLVGLFYYGYSPFSLVAGAAMDWVGPSKVLPLSAALVGIGALLFGSGNTGLASLGRLLQGAGGVFALVGAVYIATKNFPASRAATLIGATQMFGMAGGSAGQFAVGPLIGSGMSWKVFWVGMGFIGLAVGALLFFVLPKEPRAEEGVGSLKATIQALLTVFKNPQSILCGLIAGLLFIPTTIFDMIWGVRYLQEAHAFSFASAVMRSATVPFGWIIGCPLLGFISDRIGRRKPVIIGGAAVLLACLGWILFGQAGVFPPYLLGLVAGVASGAAMLPYTVIKEVNPPQFGGTATGVINFLNFTFSALFGPVFGGLLQRISGGSQPGLVHYQAAFLPLLFGVAAAMVLSLLLKETGPAVQHSLERS
jgi:MFS family permease